MVKTADEAIVKEWKYFQYAETQKEFIHPMRLPKNMDRKSPRLQRRLFMTLRYGILTLETLDAFLQSFRFLRQNGMSSATE